MPTYNNYIDGQWTPSISGQLFENRNPADSRDLIGDFQQSTVADADAAIEAAKGACPGWRLVPAPKRAEILFRAADIIERRKEESARDMTREMGKVLDERCGGRTRKSRLPPK